METHRKPSVLSLRLSGIDEGKYHVKAFVDGVPLTPDESEEIDVAWGLLPSVYESGDYFFVLCKCGDPGCAGYMDPTEVIHEGGWVKWLGDHPVVDFVFEREAYVAEIRRLVEEGRESLRHKSFLFKLLSWSNSNVSLFKSESSEERLRPSWAYEQRQRARERALKGLPPLGSQRRPDEPI